MISIQEKINDPKTIREEGNMVWASKIRGGKNLKSHLESTSYTLFKRNISRQEFVSYSYKRICMVQHCFQLDLLRFKSDNVIISICIPKYRECSKLQLFKKIIPKEPEATDPRPKHHGPA